VFRRWYFERQTSKGKTCLRGQSSGGPHDVDYGSGGSNTRGRSLSQFRGQRSNVRNKEKLEVLTRVCSARKVSEDSRSRSLKGRPYVPEGFEYPKGELQKPQPEGPKWDEPERGGGVLYLSSQQAAGAVFIGKSEHGRVDD